ncbi:CRISPR-associated protein, Csm5 family [Fervidobacterium changbaicum]|uniref:type III-A CRISPR-associated RAMP protein Csm5 n=1 Tax=Fervidobacterium changbaicum TaxID=310769 RepID=UPI00088C836D|nr:type III-A CRISPR-associated RAMP protein Csm5 [Fervidobacterium changbaicum]SDH70667.1 CRISPR-associated protein, Csm5 family [Fervidobacterium changbaicum]
MTADFSKRISIEPVSAVFIGSGEKIGKFETIVQGKKTHILNFDKLMEHEKFVDYFVANSDKIFNPETKDAVLLKIFEVLKIDLQEYSYTSFDTIFDKNGKPKTLQISRFIRTAGRYYIPGSSLKGALRTMIIKSNQKFEATLRNVFRSPNVKFEVEKVEQNIFGQPFYSPFKLLRITDSTFINNSHIKFKKVEVVHFVRQKTSIPQFVEVWLPDMRSNEGNKVAAEIISLFSNLSKLESLEEVRRNEKLKEALGYFRNLFSNEKVFVDRMKESAMIIINMERQKISTMSDNPVKKTLEEFYKKLLDINEKADRGFLVRIGGHTSFYSKTAFRGFLEPAEIKVLKNFGYRKITESNFPITTRIVKLSESPNDIMPLGWVKVELMD